MSQPDRLGPVLVTPEPSCSECVHCKTYRDCTDEYNSFCEHPESGDALIPDCDTSPDWCPLKGLPDATN